MAKRVTFGAELRTQAELERHRLEQVLDYAPASIGLLSGPEHRWTYVNDSCVQVSGRKAREEFIGKTLAETLPELEGQGILKLLDDVYRTGKPFIGRDTKLYLNRSGNRPLSNRPLDELYFDLVCHPILDATGKVEQLLVHATNVTDRVTAYKVTEVNEERFRLAQSAAQIGTWEWDLERDLWEWTAELSHMLAIPSDNQERARQLWFLRIDPADQARVLQQLETARQAETLEFEYRYQHPQNGVRWLYCKGRRLRDQSHMFGVLLDLTDRKQAEEARQQLAAIVESSDDAIISKDLRGIVTSWNAGAGKIFGYTPEEMIGRSIITVIPPELYPDEQRILETVGRGERIEHFETIRLTKSGRRIDVSLTISPVRDETGNIIGVAKIARDITQRKQAEEALRTAERLASVGRLAATVAHEVNNPLAAIMNFVYLARSTTNPDEARKYLLSAEEELDRVSHVTRQTLGFYRELTFAKPTRIGELIAPLLKVFSGRTGHKSIDIRTEIKEDPEIAAVPGEIRQVIANLLSNSLDAVESAGTIRLRVTAAREWTGQGRSGVRLTVADSGRGIPRKDRIHLFEPFFTTKNDLGTGLGLWVSNNIVERHGGKIRVRSSVAPGCSGSVFSVFLPVDGKTTDTEESRKRAA